MKEHQYISFFTATILEWKPLLKPDKYKKIVIDSLDFLVKHQKVRIYGFVVMPNHIHLLWKILPPYSLPQVQHSFLKFTAQQFKFDLQNHHPQVLERFYVGAKDRRYQFWERNPLNTLLYYQNTVEQKLNYIHKNPVAGKWRLAPPPEEYGYSSSRFYRQQRDEFGFLTHYREEFRA